MNWPAIWYDPAPKYAAARVALLPLSWLYALGWTCYRAFYDLGIKKAKQPHRPILCIGNLTVGGSGKTPLTVFVARTLAEMGHQVMISCSGYGAPRSEGATLAPDGLLDPREWGDEAALLRSLLPGVPLIVGRARVLAAQLASDGTILLMDDGFQHLPLRKTASILVDPPSSNRACLPAGPYREPRSNLRRADVVIDGEAARLVSNIMGFERLGSRELEDPPKEISALCAIGRPEVFFKSLEDLGFEVEKRIALPDHADMGGALDGLTGPIVVTAKDAVKLRVMAEALKREVYVARHEVTVEPIDWFKAKLRELIAR